MAHCFGPPCILDWALRRRRRRRRRRAAAIRQKVYEALPSCNRASSFVLLVCLSWDDEMHELLHRGSERNPRRPNQRAEQ